MDEFIQKLKAELEDLEDDWYSPEYRLDAIRKAIDALAGEPSALELLEIGQNLGYTEAMVRFEWESGARWGSW